VKALIRAGLLLAALLAAAQADPFGQVHFRTGQGFHSAMPLGYVVIQLKPSGAVLSLLGLVECPELEGLQQLSEGLRATVVSPDGVPLEHFPRTLSFRITSSLRKTILDPPERSVEIEEPPQQFLLNMGFRLKIYHGLHAREVPPTSVTNIGVPAGIAYDERVVRVTFDLEEVPVTDRLILEALSPEGETLTHFAFKLL
jgi:hypothetical protein